jgi:hypothetical protein
MAKRSTGLHLIDDHLIAIGHVAIRGSQLDALIQSTLISMAGGMPKRIEAYITKLQTRDQIALLQDVLKAIFPADEAAIVEFIKHVHGARNDRNDVIHKSWGKTDDETTVNMVDLAKPHEIKRHGMRAKDIHAIADRLFSLHMTLHAWSMKWLDMPRPLSLPSSSASPSLGELIESLARSVRPPGPYRE